MASYQGKSPGITPKLGMFNKYESRPYLGRDKKYRVIILFRGFFDNKYT
jgi:hypothetical protein